jgi:Na+-transporting NADH:ubiquinone oxidoreductase subunit D
MPDLPPTSVPPRRALLVQLWNENPICRQVLGICSALAVTNLVFNTSLMCAGLIWTTTMSGLTVSLLRNVIPQRIRIMVQVLIVAVFVIVVDIVFRAMFFETHSQIAAYVGLIITNCIVLGRLEAFASKNRPLAAVADGLGAGLGYSMILLAVAVVRELLGFGTLLKGTAWEVTVFGPGSLVAGGLEAMGLGGPMAAMGLEWRNWTIMVMPPGAFFVLAVAVWVARAHTLRREREAEAKEASQ